MPGPPPKPASQRRRKNKPKSYGYANPDTVPAAVKSPVKLGFPAQPLIRALWRSLKTSAEGRYYSAADWERLRLELWFGNELVSSSRTPGAQAWATFQAGLNTLLISPAEKRRLGIDVRAVAVDEDEEAAVLMLNEYQQKLDS
jgi:hypothetical protein